MRFFRGRDCRGEARFGDHVQTEHLGRMLGHRGVVDRQIVDEGGAGGGVAIDDRACRHALAARIGDHFMRDAVLRQLVDAPRMRFIAKVREDDDIGHLADPTQCLDRAGDDRLAVHFIAEE